MSKAFNVKGVNPMGRIVEVQIIADTATEAKAEDVELKFIVVTEASHAAPQEHQPDRRSTGN